MTFKNNFIVKTLLICTLIFASCSEDEAVEEPTVTSGLEIYTDIMFAVDADGADSKRFFSTSTGEMYTFNEIDEEIGATIDLVWYDLSPVSSGFLFWEDPSDLLGDLVMPGGTFTAIENYQPSLTADQYDLIETEEQLSMFTVVNSDEAMGPLDYPVVILFENAAGKKGVINMKSNDGEFMTADIKVIK